MHAITQDVEPRCAAKPDGIRPNLACRRIADLGHATDADVVQHTCNFTMLFCFLPSASWMLIFLSHADNASDHPIPLVVSSSPGKPRKCPLRARNARYRVLCTRIPISTMRNYPTARPANNVSHSPLPLPKAAARLFLVELKHWLLVGKDFPRSHVV
jgi:hypothetical protein